LLYHGRGLLLVVQADLRRLHGKLPALYLQQSDPAFLDEIIFQLPEFFGKVILVVPDIGDHRDLYWFFKNGYSTGLIETPADQEKLHVRSRMWKTGSGKKFQKVEGFG
jgi:hypothetical protein